LELSSRLVPAPPRIAEALATLFGNRNRFLELDEAALRMRHRGLDGDDHVELQRPIRVIALIHRLTPATRQARRFMSNEAHAMRYKIQVDPVGRTVQEPMGAVKISAPTPPRRIGRRARWRLARLGCCPRRWRSLRLAGLRDIQVLHLFPQFVHLTL